ncbi:hypothetical protein A3F66_03925 [candidate division TM6 bacterium RIFCSPHIGHO2_12_FULL_32_22]|nr:MAG: hypothetical protein A3F66_03925 [candidate division TM6 bacterium RIFCSPHIGHO2_12_FULL_32_22]
MKLLFFLLSFLSIKCMNIETLPLESVDGAGQGVIMSHEFYSVKEKIVLECGHVCNKYDLEHQNCVACGRQSQTVRIIFENGAHKFGLSKPIGIYQLLELNKCENKPATKLLSRYKSRCHPARPCRCFCCFDDNEAYSPICCGEVCGCLFSLMPLGLLFLR